MRVQGLDARATRPHAVRHDLALSSDQLGAITERHRGALELHEADLPLVHASGHRTKIDRPAGDVMHDLAGSGAWLTLFGVNDDFDLQAALTALDKLLTSDQGDITLSLQLVCSSPGGVTPAHMDAHDVLLLQLEGDKQLGTGRFARRKDSESELRQRFGPLRRNLSRLPEEQRAWPLGPGEGVFIPAYTPHWAVVGDRPSVALSVGITSKRLERRAAEHVADAVLLRRGVRLPAPGRSRLLDRARALAVSAVRKAS